MIREFKTFREAADFAAEFCRANRCTARVKRLQDGWEVQSDQNDVGHSQLHTDRATYALPDKEAPTERTTDARVADPLCRSGHDQAGRKLADKQEVLELARSGKLNKTSLAQVIDNHRMYGFSTEEHYELTELLRSKAGLSGTWRPCPQCGGDGGAGGRCPTCGGNGFGSAYEDPPF